ncbi:hypothetical protein V2J09_013453 [Rumex salicifolius]
MTWLFACFGYPNKRKRPKSSYRVHSKDKGIGSYRTLESPSSCLPEDSGEGNPKPIRSNLKRRIQGKARERKKVRFDLNVIAYEPVQGYDNDDYDDDDDLRSILAAANWGEQENEKDNTFTYRYSNCDDDNDEVESEIEDDLSDEEDDEDKEDEKITLETCKEIARKSLETSRRVNPVLIPIENLNQWRAIKMKKWETLA